jgi:hypothetical protein
VIRAGQTPHASVDRAVNALGRDHIIGVVLNAVETPAADGAKYYYARDADSPAPPAVPTTREG